MFSSTLNYIGAFKKEKQLAIDGSGRTMKQIDNTAGKKSSAVINKSIERLLERSQGLTIIIGPSTPMSPVLFDYGVDMLAGIKVVDKERMMRKIAQGGGKEKQFEDAIESLVMEK